MRVCKECGGKIPDTRRSNAKYCGEKCARKAEKGKRIDYISARANRINRVAKDVYAAYNCRCALCGWQISDRLLRVNGRYQYSHGNEIHHITAVKDGGTEDYRNLILLCPNHHKLADLKLIPDETLREHTRPYELTEEQKFEAASRCAKLVGAAIFKGVMP